MTATAKSMRPLCEEPITVAHSGALDAIGIRMVAMKVRDMCVAVEVEDMVSRRK